MTNDTGRYIRLGIFVILALIGLLFLVPLVIMDFWNWFIVPATNFNKLSYWLAMGIQLTVSLIVEGIKVNKSGDQDDRRSGEEKISDFASEVFGGYLALGLIYGIGALVHLGV